MTIQLDNPSTFGEIDKSDILAHIDGLPQQLEIAWETGRQLALPSWKSIRQVLISGMGGSAIGGDLLASYAQPICNIPIFVHRGYDLPAWAQGEHTLVISSSHSGNTEETLAAFRTAQKRDCRILAITTGGSLAMEARKNNIPVWHFEHQGQPRTAVGFSFGLLLAALTRLGLMPEAEAALHSTIKAMKMQQESIKADVPAVQNLAKRIAGQLMGRWSVVIGGEHLAPVARRWKGQINELAKAWAQYEVLPEATHNTIVSTMQPEDLLPQAMVLFLQGAGNHPRNRLRLQLMRQTFMLEGVGTDVITAQGETRLAQMWTCLHLGDYIAYYLAIAYGIDPTPVTAIENLKKEMKAAAE